MKFDFEFEEEKERKQLTTKAETMFNGQVNSMKSTMLVKKYNKYLFILNF